jgi:hypothetical protein
MSLDIGLPERKEIIFSPGSETILEFLKLNRTIVNDITLSSLSNMILKEISY